ncbi:hypothetical protein HPB51_010279 [Rhipicephalus microplus]|uniref:ENT domain-containing protein n=1 Tax=Rhipicephalus microplus TaxID=6941 RepID=A0A9J6D4V3_RHIMP|nr:hypothetical protein HPB51_010279 [Rhipicephalus microplus]
MIVRRSVLVAARHGHGRRRPQNSPRASDCEFRVSCGQDFRFVPTETTFGEPLFSNGQSGRQRLAPNQICARKSTAMWPMVLDYTKDECQRMLRKLELEAYAAVVSAFRAQGELTKDKKKTLQELSNILCISLERHRAEIRRAVNDERLNTIAERIVGPNTSSNWAMEGRRLVPLMPRLVPQTAFSALANSVANSLASAQAAKSAAASPTSSSVAAALEKELLQFTGNSPSAATPSCSGLNGPTTSPRPLQAAAVVRPSAAWTPPTASGSMPKVPSPAVAKAEPLPIVPDVSSADEDNTLRKRKRSLSLDSLPSTSNAAASAIMPTSPPTTVALTTNTAAAAVPIPASAAPAPTPTAAPLARVTTNSPVVTKVVVPTSLPSTSVSPSVTTKVVSLPAASTTQLRVPVVPQRTTNVPTCSQKVILVSTTAASSPMSSGLQRPHLSVPVVKTVSAPGTAPLVHQGKAPVVMGLQASSAAHPSSPAALTSVTSVVTTPVPSASVAMTGEPGVVRLRPRAVTVNPRMPVRVPRVPAPVPPSMGGGAPQLPCPSPSYGKATISVPKGAIMQYRHEGKTDGNRATSRSFGVFEMCVRDWRKQKQKIVDSKASRKGFSGPQQGRFPQIEELLGEYVLEQRAAQRPVTTELLQVRAMQLALEKGVMRSQFKASSAG